MLPGALNRFFDIEMSWIQLLFSRLKAGEKNILFYFFNLGKLVL